MLSVAFSYCYAEHRYAERRYAEHRYAECHYAECRGDQKTHFFTPLNCVSESSVLNSPTFHRWRCHDFKMLQDDWPDK
jgi:hypothetical protein